MILYDTHTHSTLSHDGISTLIDMANAAREKGLKGLYLTEHCDFRLFPEGSVCRYFESDIVHARKKLPAGIELPFAIEIAQVPWDIQKSAELLKRHDYDFVIGSQHLLPGNQSVMRRRYENLKDCEEVLSQYLDCLLEAAEIADYDTLAHVDYPLRYFYVNAGILMALEDKQEQVDAILKVVIERGKALELNTAAIRKGYPHLMEATLRRFRELGGRYVTIGSDAHQTQDICASFEEAEQVVQRSGFSAYTIFRHRQPIEISF